MDGTSVHPLLDMPNQCLFLGVDTKGRSYPKGGRGKARGGWGEGGGGREWKSKSEERGEWVEEGWVRMTQHFYVPVWK